MTRTKVNRSGCIGLPGSCIPARRDDGNGFSIGNDIMTFTGVKGPLGSGGGNLSPGRNLRQQIRVHGRTVMQTAFSVMMQPSGGLRITMAMFSARRRG